MGTVRWKTGQALRGTHRLLVVLEHAVLEHGQLEVVIRAQQVVKATLGSNLTVLEEHHLEHHQIRTPSHASQSKEVTTGKLMRQTQPRLRLLRTATRRTGDDEAEHVKGQWTTGKEQRGDSPCGP